MVFGELHGVAVQVVTALLRSPANGHYIYGIDFNYHYYNSIIIQSQGVGIFIMGPIIGMALTERLPEVGGVTVCSGLTVCVASE